MRTIIIKGKKHYFVQKHNEKEMWVNKHGDVFVLTVCTEYGRRIVASDTKRDKILYQLML